MTPSTRPSGWRPRSPRTSSSTAPMPGLYHFTAAATRPALIEQQLRKPASPCDVGRAELFDRPRSATSSPLRLLRTRDDDPPSSAPSPRRAAASACHHRGPLGVLPAIATAACLPRCSRPRSPASECQAAAGRAGVRRLHQPPCSTAPARAFAAQLLKTCSARSATRPGCSSTGDAREAESKWSNVRDLNRLARPQRARRTARTCSRSPRPSR